MVKLIQF